MTKTLSSPELPDPAHGDEERPNLAARRDSTELGRKGSRTRRRLMDAAGALLEDQSPVTLTPRGIARAANTSAATFYVYFQDVTDIVRALAEEANDDLDDVLAMLAEWLDHGDVRKGATAFVDTFHAHWDKYRTILAIRNLEADRGNVPFRQMRRAAGARVITPLARILAAAHSGEPKYTADIALARATVLFAAIERLAAAAETYPEEERGPPDVSDLRAAQIDLLCEAVTIPRAG